MVLSNVVLAVVRQCVGQLSTLCSILGAVVVKLLAKSLVWVLKIHLQTCVLWWYRKLAKRLSMARENQKRFVKTLVYVTPMGVDVDVWLIIHALIQKATVAVANLTTLQHAVNSFAVVPNLKMRVSLFEHSCRGLVV